MTGRVFERRRRDGISTHTLRKEGDETGDQRFGRGLQFQPTPSARRVTHKQALKMTDGSISTHTLRKEGDLAHC